MIGNVKIEKIDGSDVYITINCFEDTKKTRIDNEILRIPIRRIIKPPIKGEYKNPIETIDGIMWPSFVEYLTKIK